MEEPRLGWWLEEYDAVGGGAGRGGRLLLEDDAFDLCLFLLGPLKVCPLEDEIVDGLLGLLKVSTFQRKGGLEAGN